LAKATLVIEDFDDGMVKASVTFDPPLPDGERNEAWLDKIPTCQLTGMLLMDYVMDRLEGEAEVSVITDEDENGTRH